MDELLLYEPCSKCGGTGEERYSDAAGSRDYRLCRKCKGARFIRHEKAPTVNTDCTDFKIEYTCCQFCIDMEDEDRVYVLVDYESGWLFERHDVHYCYNCGRKLKITKED